MSNSSSCRYEDFPHYVYLGISNKKNKSVKIGYSWNIRVRLNNIRSNKKINLVLAAYIPARSAYAAYKIEQKLLVGLQKYRKNTRSEWLNFSPEIITFFLNQKKSVICLECK